MSARHQYPLDESQLPRAWYNINADLPVPPKPVLHPATMQPVTPDFLGVLFPMSLILQEVSTERYIEIPEPVREIYRLWRPTPLLRALRLERALDTPAHIYYKYEGVSPVGSHKPNTAVAQAFYNKEAGTRALATETGAGQWGSAMAMACNFFDLDLEIYMVKVSYQQKPYRRIIMEHFGADVYASPTTRTHAGRAALESDPDNPGSLGLAISEAVEVAATSGGRMKYALGSVLGHVLMHQTVIGLEALQQMEMAGEYPDFVIGCAGGGSNFAGFAYPFLHQNLTAGKKTPHHRRGAGLVPEPDPRPVRVRLGRPGGHRPHRQDAHPRPYLHPAGNPRRRAAVPRDGAERERPGRPRRHRGPRGQAAGDLRRGGPVLPRRGDHPRAGERPRHPGRH